VVELTLVGVRVEVPSNQPIVLLKENTASGRYLPIFIGQPEATAIVFALQEMETPRPMTHDLFTNVLDDLAVRLERIRITDLRDGTFYAELDLRANGEVHQISSRPSDAIALAVRQDAPVPIFAEESVLDEAGVQFEEDDEEQQVEQFREFLDKIEPEDFEP
jgi:bifunctional DNase/RNase